MTNAPEKITLTPNHLFGSPWSNAYIGDDDPMEDGEDTSYGYVRSDIVQARIVELEYVLKRLDKWFDADIDVLEAMSDNELVSHKRAHALICSALKT
tara:strand:+ start:342 stop:632 length:291 start_codon:yes stop_codon:yes gene_type:complete